jgi:hypothetical protein
VISIGKEASSGLYCEYTYQFSKILPVKVKSYLVSDIFSTDVFQTTGLASVCAFVDAERKKINKINK